MGGEEVVDYNATSAQYLQRARIRTYCLFTYCLSLSLFFFLPSQQLLNQNYCPSFPDQETEDQSGSVIWSRSHSWLALAGWRLGFNHLPSQSSLTSPSST